MAYENYGFIDAKIKKALVSNRKEAPFDNRADKPSISERISILEDRLVNERLSYQAMFEIQQELKCLKR